MKQVCWHSRRSKAYRGLPEARGQSEAHGDSNLYTMGYDHASPQNCLFWGPGFGTSFCSILRPLLSTYMGEVLAAAGSESFMVEKSIAGSGARAEPLRCDRHLNCIALACRCNSSLFSDVGPLETIAENKTEQNSAAKRRQRLLKASQQSPS